MNHATVRYSRHGRTWALAFGLFASMLLSACPDSGDVEPSAVAAELVLTNGRFYTVDSARSWADTVAVAGGRIVYVGTERGVDEYIGPETRIADLGGRMVLPGLHDAHIHALRSGIELLGVSLFEHESVDAYLAAVDAYAAEFPDEPWILGTGWSMAAFGPGARVSRRLLDEVVSDRPVYLESADGHSAWVNSRALEIAGVDESTADPDGGVIDREPGTRVPLGSLQEPPAMDLVEGIAPAPDLETRMQAMQEVTTRLHAYGITSIQEAKAVEDELAAYRTLDDRGELDLRIVAAIEWDAAAGLQQISDLERLRKTYTGGRLRATTVKITQDGVMENFTAALLEPYIGQNGGRGKPQIDPERLMNIVTRLDAAGFQVHFHAIGDAATRQCLDAVEAARRTNGVRGNRHHISHLQLIDPGDIPRFRQLDVVANFQPVWAYADRYITELTEPFLGAERMRWMYPIASVRDAGAVVAFGSDWSVSTANPFVEMEVAVTRRAPDGSTTDPLVAEEAIALPDAIAAFTIAAAWVNGSEADTGSIEAGKYADLAVLDRNLFAIPPGEISETRVVATLLGGEVVHGSLDFD